MNLDVDSCYRALAARDARFDGLFYVGVATTGIYCRPVCTARLPRADRCTFYRSAAEAERAGFRACFRCRPELAPGRAPLDSVPRLVAAAVARIDEGYLNDASVDDLAAELGVAARHLRRAVQSVLGVSPAELARSRRLALAKQLLHDTHLTVTEIALASGFGSVRRFHAAFRAVYDTAPTALRRARTLSRPGAWGRASEASLFPGQHPRSRRRRRPGRENQDDTGLRLRLTYRRPFDWARLLAFLAARAVPGVEDIAGDVYRRDVRLGEHRGEVVVTDDPDASALRVELAPGLAGAAMAVTARLRALFDLDARPDEIAAALGNDRTLGPMLRARPGLRVPGAFDPFEVAVRAVLGQQVSVKGASTLAARLVAHFGGFPTPHELAASRAAMIAKLGMPATRARALVQLGAACAGPLRLVRGADPEATIAALEALPGIGPWTAQYVAMRALGWPDAWASGDLILRRALGDDAEARAEAWRPWRAYAVLHLWTAAQETA